MRQGQTTHGRGRVSGRRPGSPGGRAGALLRCVGAGPGRGPGWLWLWLTMRCARALHRRSTGAALAPMPSDRGRADRASQEAAHGEHAAGRRALSTGARGGLAGDAQRRARCEMRGVRCAMGDGRREVCGARCEVLCWLLFRTTAIGTVRVPRTACARAPSDL